MTRINVIDPTLLSNRHLLAEYRELPRVFGLVRAAQKRGERPQTLKAPSTYTLGTGHVKFFYTRLQWLLNRQRSLILECQSRGFNIQHTDPSALVDDLNPLWLNDWTPTETDKQKNIDRINARGGLRHKET
jgi:deoxyribonuclease (pyrimidine dimer)